MEGRKKETFKKGLISAAKSTNAIILTGGTNTGTMKLVGDAIREGQFMVQVYFKEVTLRTFHHFRFVDLE